VDGLQADTIVKNAGTAMHHAKQRNKNSFQFYSNELNARALAKLTLANELRKALDRDELHLYYQPKVELKTSVITGAEALVRWQHPKRGWVSPQEFIPLAEENGLIVPLGQWVMRAACKQSKAWRSAGLKVPRIAINVSSYQFRHGRFAETVAQTLIDTGAEAQDFGLELTEGVIMDNVKNNVETLRQLKEIGLKLSIDDFGTGYSSLSRLSEFPIELLKIPKPFVTRLVGEEGNELFVDAILRLAESLDLVTVSKGVEQVPQLQRLLQLGCALGQGFLFSKPLAETEVVELLADPDRYRGLVARAHAALLEQQPAVAARS
jgi:EAL domain-containing protein (putative c-di-GMP-specific phosphodiesterase class I)